jgi:phasin protein
MSTTHEDKSSDKPRQRGRKAGRRDQKIGSQPNPRLDQRDGDQIDSVIAATDVAASATAAPAEQSLIGEADPTEPAGIEDVAVADASPSEATASADENPPVNLQTIANAYRDYTKKSVQESRSFVEKLMGVRSLDKAFEVQTDYATQAYANFVAQSQRICGLYSELASQTLKPGKRHG